MAESNELPRQANEQDPPPKEEVGPWRYRVTYPTKGGGEESYYATIVPDNGDPDTVWRQQLMTRRKLRGLRPEQVTVVREGELNAEDNARIARVFGDHKVRMESGTLVAAHAVPPKTRAQIAAEREDRRAGKTFENEAKQPKE
jgi:hypothetical protein